MTTKPQPVSPQLLEFAQAMRSEYQSTIHAAGAPDPVAEVRSLNIAADNPTRSQCACMHLRVKLTRHFRSSFLCTAADLSPATWIPMTY
jgi:hypothetical protein